MKLRLWLVLLDATRAVFGFGSHPYLWVLARASNAEWKRYE